MAILATFVVTTWLLAMLPGVGQALMLRQTLEHGRLSALATVAGTSTGLIAWSMAAAGGLSAVILASDIAYTALRCGGGLFLAWMGVQSLRSARTTDDLDIARETDGGSGRRAYLAGLVTNLGNPKAGVFAISLLPQFAPSTGPVFAATVGLGIIWALVTGAWYIVFVMLVHQCRGLVTRPRTQRALARATGVVLLGLGGAVAMGV